MDAGSLFAGIVRRADREVLETLVTAPGVRIERIVSTGQATPAGEWYDQDADEWVVVVSGRAGLRFESEAAARVLGPGDWVHIPAHARHRVEWTDTAKPTIWLAVHHRP